MSGRTEPLIKIDLERRLASGDPVVLELGVGNRPTPGRIGIDRIDLPAVDIVADLERGFPYLPDASVDEIHSSSVLEHVDDFEFLMREIVRVLKPGGRKVLFVPHFSNPYFYSDYTHRRFFGLYTFQYFVESEHQLARKVPSFYTDIRLRVVSQRLVFASPFTGRNRVKKLVGRVVNSRQYFQEFYEENLCFLFPCYGLEVVLTPDK